MFSGGGKIGGRFCRLVFNKGSGLRFCCFSLRYFVFWFRGSYFGGRVFFLFDFRVEVVVFFGIRLVVFVVLFLGFEWLFVEGRWWRVLFFR